MTGFQAPPDVLTAMLAKAEEIDEETARTDLQDAEELVSACRNYLNIR